MGQCIGKTIMINVDKIYFNELSLFEGLVFNKYYFIECIKFLKRNGVKMCMTIECIKHYLSDCKVLSRDEKNLALSFLKYPFYSQNFENNVADTNYINDKCIFMKMNCIGFLYAISTNSFVLSFYSDKFNESEYTVSYKKFNNDGFFDIHVENLSSDLHFNNIIGKFSDTKVLLKKSLLTYEDKYKKSKLPTDNHHGTEDLKKYIPYILKNDYVDYVLTSISQNQSNRFIKMNEDLTVDVRLIWLDRHPGIRIITTGKNIQEVKEICKKLETELPRW